MSCSAAGAQQQGSNMDTEQGEAKGSNMDTEQQHTGVDQLLISLPQAKNASQCFGLFADKLHSIFEGLQHVR
jgi:hypothetical protein